MSAVCLSVCLSVYLSLFRSLSLSLCLYSSLKHTHTRTHAHTHTHSLSLSLSLFHTLKCTVWLIWLLTNTSPISKRCYINCHIYILFITWIVLLSHAFWWQSSYRTFAWTLFEVDLKTRGLGIEQILCLFNFWAKHINL